jgi:hypothetical protein
VRANHRPIAGNRGRFRAAAERARLQSRFTTEGCLPRHNLVARSWPKRQFDDWLNHAEPRQRGREKCLQMRPFRDVRRRASFCPTRPVTPEVAGSPPPAAPRRPPRRSSDVQHAWASLRLSRTRGVSLRGRPSFIRFLTIAATEENPGSRRAQVRMRNRRGRACLGYVPSEFASGSRR